MKHQYCHCNIVQYQDSDRGSEGNQRVRLVEAWRAQASCVLCQGVYSVYCIFPSQLCSGTSGAPTNQLAEQLVVDSRGDTINQLCAICMVW